MASRPALFLEPSQRRVLSFVYRRGRRRGRRRLAPAAPVRASATGGEATSPEECGASPAAGRGDGDPARGAVAPDAVRPGAATPPGPARATPEFAVPRRLLRRGPRIGGGRGRGGGAGIARSRGRGGARGRPRARELRYDAGRHRRRRRLATLAPLARRGRGGAPQPPVAADAEGRLRRLLGAAARGGLLSVHVRRGVPEISADTSLDTSIARRHAIAAASSQCLIRAGTSASARRAPAPRTPARCAGGPSRTCSASSCLDLLYHHRRRRRSAALIKYRLTSASVSDTLGLMRA